MPKSWWVYAENRVQDGDSEAEIAKKQLYAKLCASKKPYFFAYVYPSLKSEYDSYVINSNSNAIAAYKKPITELIDDYNNGLLTNDGVIQFVRSYINRLPLDLSKSTINLICWAVESEFDGVNIFDDVQFDYNMLKTDKLYDTNIYNIIKHICKDYMPNVLLAKKRNVVASNDDEQDWSSVDVILERLIENISSQCPNEEDLCNILLDLCYSGGVNKQIVWKACGDIIYKRLLRRNNYIISYPVKNEDGDFWCQGIKYSMQTVVKKEGDSDEN